MVIQEPLQGKANHYCIAIESNDSSQIALVRKALSKTTARGLLPLSSRFVDSETVDKEPLVLAARIGQNGELTDCKTPWILSAWKEARQKHSTLSQVQSKESVESKKVGKLNIWGKVVIYIAIVIFVWIHILSGGLSQLTDSKVLQVIMAGGYGYLTVGILKRAWDLICLLKKRK